MEAIEPMTRTEIERLAVVEQRIEDVCTAVDDVRADIATLAAEVRKAIEGKADKSEVLELKRYFIGALLGVAGTAVTTLLGIFVYNLQSHM